MPHDGEPTSHATHPNISRSVADRLIESYAVDTPTCGANQHDLPSPIDVARLLEDVRELLFPGYTTGMRPAGAAMRAQVEARVAQVRVTLTEQVFRGLHRRCDMPGVECARCADEARSIADKFLDTLPSVRALLMTDVRAAWDGDPAATCADEILFSYPGVNAIAMYRIAHELFRLGALMVPRMMTEIAHSKTGVDIHPGATIGQSFFIDHGTGVVIGETTVIGTRVRIYQGVTLGALSLPTGRVRSLARTKRHPTIEDDVIIYANATILGGETVIGRGAVIGANAWITESVAGKVPAGHRKLVEPPAAE